MNDLKKKIKVLDRQRRVAWANYYRSEEDFYELSTFSYECISKLTKELSNKKIPKHLTDEIMELNAKLKNALECPICYTMLNKDNAKITICGHKFCKDCYDKIDECSICRKKIWKKKD